MPKALRRFLAMTARVAIIHVADTAFTMSWSDVVSAAFTRLRPGVRVPQRPPGIPWSEAVSMDRPRTRNPKRPKRTPARP